MTCVLNRCGRPQGIGTWVRVEGVPSVLPVCEDHWQAMRRIIPLNTKTDPPLTDK